MRDGVSESGLGSDPLLLSAPCRKALGRQLQGDVKSKILASMTVQRTGVKGEPCNMPDTTS